MRQRGASTSALVAEISSLVRKNDDDFLSITLPAIDRDEHDEAVLLHAETEQVVGRVAKPNVPGSNERDYRK